MSRDGIELEARCSRGKTPLHIAAGLGWLESVERLVRAGCDVNRPDNGGNSPLHVSVQNPDICHLLIQSGARIDSINELGATALHEAIRLECHEVLCMLLYYNADANVANKYSHTPFMIAILWHNIEAQRVILEYVDDFNRFSYLRMALQMKSPFVRDIIEKGADVNYADNPKLHYYISAFNLCLFNRVDQATFKTVWERLLYNDSKNTIDLMNFFDGLRNCSKVVPAFLQVIIDSENFEPAVKFFTKHDSYKRFVFNFSVRNFNLKQLTALTCRLLQCGFRVTSHDIGTIFFHHQYCELFRILLYMDNDYGLGWQPFMIVPRIIFDIDYDLENIISDIHEDPKWAVPEILEYFILDGLPKVPSLMQLARDTARKHIRNSFNITTTCQFYTTIDHLNIPKPCKQVLTFERKIYMKERRDEIDFSSD